MFAKVVRAEAEFASVAVEDLRRTISDHLRGSADASELTLESYHELIATLLPLKGCSDVPELSFNIDQYLSLAPLIPLLEITRTAYERGA